MVCCCKKNFTHSIGLISYLLGGIDPGDVEFVAAFDVNEKKIGKDLSDAIFQFPNNTPKIINMPNLNIKVLVFL